MKKILTTAAMATLLLAGTVAPAFAQGGSGGGGSTSGGGGSTSTTTVSGGGGGGAGGKTACIEIETPSVVAGYRPGAMGITASYNLALCTSGKTYSSFKMKNVATGVTEYQTGVGFNATSTTWDGPAFDTDYQVDIAVLSAKDYSVLEKSSVIVHTPVMVANCAAISRYNLSAGYYINYAAIWTAYAVTDCGYGRQNVKMTITNLTSGVVEAQYSRLPSQTMIDYEGPIVKYDSDYQIDVSVYGAQNELLDSHSEITHTPVIR